MNNYLGNFQIILSKENKNRTTEIQPIEGTKNFFRIINYIDPPPDAVKLLLQIKVDNKRLSLEEFDEFIKKNYDNFYMKHDEDKSTLIRLRLAQDISSGIVRDNGYYNYELILDEVLTINLPICNKGESNLPDEFEYIYFDDVLLYDCVELEYMPIIDFHNENKIF